MKNYSVKFKSWYKKNDNGNVHIPLIAFGYNSLSIWIGFLGFSLSVWKEAKRNKKMKTYQLSEAAKQAIINQSGSPLVLNFELKCMSDQDFFIVVSDSLIKIK